MLDNISRYIINQETSLIQGLSISATGKIVAQFYQIFKDVIIGAYYFHCRIDFKNVVRNSFQMRPFSHKQKIEDKAVLIV